MFEPFALVTIDSGNGSPIPAGLEELARAFRTAGRPVVHVSRGDIPTQLVSVTAPDLDRELLAAGGVQTLGFAEMAIALRAESAFDATPLDALLRSLGITSVVLGGNPSSAELVETARGAELRGYHAVAATEELVVAMVSQLESTSLPA